MFLNEMVSSYVQKESKHVILLKYVFGVSVLIILTIRNMFDTDWMQLQSVNYNYSHLLSYVITRDKK